MTRLLRGLLILVVANLVSQGALVLPASAGTVFYGTCNFTLTVTFTGGGGGISTPPGTPGTCDTNDGENAPSTLGAPTLGNVNGALALGCTGGAVSGNAEISVSLPDNVIREMRDLAIEAVSRAGVASIVVHKVQQPQTVVGAGTFVQTPAVTDCGGNPTSVTWTGTLAFFDPVI